MAEQLAGTAIIRLKLALSPQDRALLDGLGVGPGRVPGGGGSGGAGGGFAPGGRAPIVPGGRGGPSMLSGLGRGGGMAGAAGLVGALIAASPVASFLAQPVGDAIGGFNKRFRNAGTDVSEALGLAGYAREADIAPRAADRTVAQLGIAAKYATEAQIKSLYGLNSQMATAEVEAENRVRETIGSKRVEAFIERITNALEKIVSNTAPKSAPAATTAAPRAK